MFGIQFLIFLPDFKIHLGKTENLWIFFLAIVCLSVSSIILSHNFRSISMSV